MPTGYASKRANDKANHKENYTGLPFANCAKGLLEPAFLLPIPQKAYWRMRSNASKVLLSREAYFSLPALKCMVSYNKYGGYCVPESSKHRPAAKKILSNDVYEPRTIQFLMAHCGKGDIIHAGTYFGDFLPALSHASGSACRVWAFEPNPENYKCAKITALINNLDNVELTNAGLGERESMSWIRTLDESGNALGGGSEISRNKPETQISDGVHSVPIVAIDQSIPRDRQVKVIQLDVEGYEKEALTGSLGTIRRCRPIIILEVWPTSNLLESNWFSENILSLGYQQTEIIHGNSVFMCTTH